MESPTKFNPDTQQKKHYHTGRISLRTEHCTVCHKLYDSFKAGKEYQCKRTKACRSKAKEVVQQLNVITGECYRGWYEHLGTTPVWIESKAHLYKECVKRGVQARALMSGGRMVAPRGV